MVELDATRSPLGAALKRLRDAKLTTRDDEGELTPTPLAVAAHNKWVESEAPHAS